MGNFVIAEAREEDGRYPRESMEHEFEMESQVPEGQEVSERLFFQNRCKKENELCATGLTRCCNKDHECQVCKLGSQKCKSSIFGAVCFPCFGIVFFKTCQPKATTTPATTVTTPTASTTLAPTTLAPTTSAQTT